MRRTSTISIRLTMTVKRRLQTSTFGTTIQEALLSRRRWTKDTEAIKLDTMVVQTPTTSLTLISAISTNQRRRRPFLNSSSIWEFLSLSGRRDLPRVTILTRISLESAQMARSWVQAISIEVQILQHTMNKTRRNLLPQKSTRL